MPKVVFSKTLKHAPWGKWNNGRIVRGSAVEEVAKLKQTGKNLLISGSISLAQSLIDERIVDEYRLVLCPGAFMGKEKKPRKPKAPAPDQYPGGGEESDAAADAIKKQLEGHA